MRISDWSSDVCSSDLDAGEEGRLGQSPARHVSADGRRPAREAVRRAGPALFGPARRLSADHQGGHPRIGRSADGDHRVDRKSVVEGKSVAVRVDLGGRRIIKKKKTKNKKDNKK